MRKIILLVLVALFLMPVSVCAAEYEYTGETSDELYPEAEMDGLMNSLPEDVRGEIEAFISAQGDSERYESLKDKLEISYWLSFVSEKLRENLFPCFESCAALLAIILLGSMTSYVMNTCSGETVKQICALMLSLVTAVTVARITVSSINIAIGFIAGICSVMTAMLPVMEAVMITGGSVTQASVSGASLMICITLMQNVTAYVIVPLTSALFALSATSGVFTGVNVSSLVSGVRRVLITVLGFFFMIFSFVLGIQTSLARSADSLGMKTVRFALGSYVPVVGGAVSEALSTVAGGLSLIRKTAGAVGIIIILLIVLPALINLFLSRLTLVICRSAADIVGCPDASRIIGDADAVLSVFLGFSVMSAVFFIFAVTLFMNSGIA